MARVGFACNFHQPVRTAVKRNLIAYSNLTGTKPFARHLSSSSHSLRNLAFRRCACSSLVHAFACNGPPQFQRRLFVTTGLAFYNPRYRNNNSNDNYRSTSNGANDSYRSNDNFRSNQYSYRPRRSFERRDREYNGRNDNANNNYRPRSVMSDVVKEEQSLPVTTRPFNKVQGYNAFTDSRSSARSETKSVFDEDSADDVAADAEAEKQLKDAGEENSDSAVDVEFLEYPDLSPEQNKQFKMIQFEYHVLHQAGHMVPDEMLEKHWRSILREPTRASRLRYYRYLFKTEKSRDNAAAKKKIFSENYLVDRDRRLEEHAEREKLGLLTYGLNFNSMFFRIRETTMSHHKHFRLCYARMLDQPLIIDVGYEQHMREQEMKSLTLQIRDAHAYNCSATEPFYFQLVNVNRSGRFFEMLQLAIPNIDTSEFIAELSDQHYLDLFPPEQLCILTKDSPNLLYHYDSDKKYVIGGLVDRRYPQPYTYAKAKRERVATARLPIDELLIWKQGDKNLTINQVVGIMVDAKCREYTMEEALKRHIPTRKYMTDRDLQEAKDENIPITEMKARYSRAKPELAESKKRRNYGLIDELMTM